MNERSQELLEEERRTSREKYAYVHVLRRVIGALAFGGMYAGAVVLLFQLNSYSSTIPIYWILGIIVATSLLYALLVPVVDRAYGNRGKRVWEVFLVIINIGLVAVVMLAGG